MNRIDAGKLLRCLSELASQEFQEGAWLATSGPEVSSFSELISQTFDDTGLADCLDSSALDELVGVQAAEALRKLDQATAKVERTLPPQQLISDPNMATVRDAARRAFAILSLRSPQ